MKITEISQLKEGSNYLIYSEQFDVTNLCRMISHDYTGLGRGIAYFQIIRPNSTLLFTKDWYIKQIKNNEIPDATFALWDFELQRNTVTETDLTGLPKKLIQTSDKKIRVLLNKLLEEHDPADIFKELSDMIERAHKEDFEKEVLDFIEIYSGYEVIKCESLAEQYKFEEFKEQLEANPYQLKLV